MSNIYENCPSFENENYLLRFSKLEDANDLLSVYSDENSLPFFNSDNCHGDNFYYQTIEEMKKAINFWHNSYDLKWFVRWTIIEKRTNKAIGTIELFHRVANDDFNHVGVLRLDIKNDYEKSNVISEILNLILEDSFNLFDCNEIISKVPVYAIERKEAFGKLGFVKSDKFLIGTIDRYAYKDYWVLNK